MTARDERAVGTAILAILAIIGLAAGLVLPWFEYDHSSGRQTPPDAAYNRGEDGVVREHLTFYADHWDGDGVEPSDAGLARTLTMALPVGLAAAALCLLAVGLGEVRAIHRFVTRRVALALASLALAFIAAVAVAAWIGLPESMAGHGVDSPYTARLDEPDGYTSSTMAWGWYATAAALVPTIGAVLFKVQAGVVDLDAVARLLRRQERA